MLSTFLFVFPLGLLASVLPISILGAGAREVALISLLASYGVNQATAIGISTAYLGCLWFLGIIGGLLHTFGGSLSSPKSDCDTIRSFE